MSVSINNQVKKDISLIEIIFGHHKKNSTSEKQSKSVKKDMLTISQEAQELSKISKSTGKSMNIRANKSIDLKTYIDNAKKSNLEVLEKVGNKIDVNAVTYTNEIQTFNNALTEKYAKLVEESKTHSNPRNYIELKYSLPGSENYESDLSDAERSTGYQNEISMYENGKVLGVNMQDSLFRGIDVKYYVTSNTEMAFQRQVVNNQISNIFTSAGIDKSKFTAGCSFSVDPYSYQISVNGVDDDTKIKMEQALNVGDNGKNLFLHILTSATRDGSNSTQVDKISRTKYQAYQDVYEFTGLKLNELIEKDGTYYTQEGEDVRDIVSKNICKSSEVPNAYKTDLILGINDQVSKIATKGWNKLSDMKLTILYSANGLEDTKQAISFARKSEWCNSKIGNTWYATF